jgi:hypothetical protein
VDGEEVKKEEDTCIRRRNGEIGKDRDNLK